MATFTASNAPLKIVLFLGTVRENRLGLRLAKFMLKQIEKSGHEVTFFDPLEMKFPLLEKPIFHYDADRSGAPDWLIQAEKTVNAADAYVVVSGEYNHCIPPALSNMMDYFGNSSYMYKPSGIVCYSPGMYGGMRSAMQLRTMLGELGCTAVSNIFGVPKVNQSLTEDGEPTNDHMVRGADRLLNQVYWHANAMRNQRENFGLP
ncbi:quinone reductase-like [Glandiceps talaboti]